MAFEVTNSRGGSRGRGRGFGGDRGGGRGGGSRGFRGGDRGGRGSFRGGDRGSMRGAFRGGNRDFGGSSRGRNSNEEGPPVCHEVAHALQLRISYKTADVPSDKDVLQQFPGLHSRFQKSTDNKDFFLLFKDIESLENAKAELEKDDDIESVDYMGLKSVRNQSIENRQIFLQFTSDQDEDAVKELDSNILSVEFLKDKSSCLAEFATAEEANVYLKKLSGVKDRGDLKFGRESTAMKVNNHAKASIQSNQIVVRDIPKIATLKELATLYPDANSVMLYNATFPSSDYCHASFRFGSLDRVKAILSETKSPKILGKKVYVFPAYSCLLADMPKLGETWTGDQKAAAKSVDAALVKDSKQSPSKKMKLEDDDMNGDEEEEEDEDEEESDEEENGKADNEANMESAADQDEESDDDEEADEEEESDD